MHSSFPNSALELPRQFPFRPWVRRAGLSILVVSATLTAAGLGALLLSAGARYGWLGEPFAWIYLGALWLGGGKVFAGTFRPVAEVGEEVLVIRPLHQFRQRVIPWAALLGTEQTVPGDRMIFYYETPRGMRFVALNLNLVKGRRPFTELIHDRLRAAGFVERVEGRSTYMTRTASSNSEI